ncbi:MULTISPECIES: spore cortex biosynthesis protein YabQ [Paenibacillus]|uniref:Spore cortex biosynthesis protein YabQ n=1 Tax=Paenibacillus violae TaxID=3077234 RepID=A0ABU3RPT1_9BACL|nr:MULTISPECIES: spore cortex biosynthesis protein YabQ [Paenibacillus]MDU0206101.1 spore cortex biosynthesis protein YabQ [Paenibacillus sp. PFR10]MEC0269906.1 spore cortex biosynthesis protein YabQ [Paenibacillus anseongense]
MTLNVQFHTIFMMFLSGVAISAMFDVFRVLSGKLRLPRWTIPLVDTVYWIVATILVFRLLIYSNEGQVRMFIFLGMGIGICFYFAFLSQVVVHLTLFLIRVVIAIYKFIAKTVEILIIKPIIGLYRLTVIILGFLLAVAIFLYRIVLQLLYPLWRLLLWMTRPVHKYFVIPDWLKKLTGKIVTLYRRLFSK